VKILAVNSSGEATTALTQGAHQSMPLGSPGLEAHDAVDQTTSGIRYGLTRSSRVGTLGEPPKVWQASVLDEFREPSTD
jgi:hypothetical protein